MKAITSNETTAVSGEPSATNPTGAAIRVSDVTYSYAESSPTPVLGQLSFDVAPGEFVCVVGPSGCGKTTLLRVLSGLVQADAGSVEIDGVAVAGPPKGLSLVFQDYARALLPWRSALRNVELGLESLGLPRGEDRRRLAREALAEVQLPDVERAYPAQLSGGMQQRLQIARAIVTEPSILLMDEPFASLDALTRFALEDAILGLWAEHRPTVIFVTHDLDEAIYLADRVIVLRRDPAWVVREVPVDLSRPRNQGRTRAEDRFVELRYELFETIRELGGGQLT